VNIESGQEKEQYKIVRGNITLKEKQGKADLAKKTLHWVLVLELQNTNK